jgi:hypothetical protein
MTTILEFYHNDAGMTAGEYGEYLGFLQAASASGSASVAQARSAGKSFFSQPNLMQNYLFIKLSWPEPFNLVDFTPSAFSIYCVDDNSALAALALSYDPVTNFELDVTPTLFLGAGQTQYGSKPSTLSVNILARYYF